MDREKNIHFYFRNSTGSLCAVATNELSSFHRSPRMGEGGRIFYFKIFQITIGLLFESTPWKSPCPIHDIVIASLPSSNLISKRGKGIASFVVYSISIIISN